MVVFTCANYEYADPLTLYLPMAAAVPALILNTITIQLVLAKKEFDHVFYRLISVFTFMSLQKWTMFLVYKIMTATRYACPTMFRALLDSNKTIPIFLLPNYFCYFTIHHVGVLIALNRITTAIAPIAAKKFWTKYEKLIYWLTIILVILHCVPYAFQETVYDEEKGIGQKYSMVPSKITKLQINFLNVLTVILVLIMLFMAIYSLIYDHGTAQFANERNMLHTGIMLSITTSFEAFATVIKHSGVITAEARGVMQDITLLIPIFIILAMDSVLSNSVLVFLKLKKNSNVVHVQNVHTAAEQNNEQ